MKRLLHMAFLLCCSMAMMAQSPADSALYRGMHIYSDSAIFQGINVKIDLFNSILEAARSRGQLQTYEMAINIRLKNRFFPTIEGGYAFGETGVDGAAWKGRGGFGKVGLDINGLRKNVGSLNGLLVGLRVGTAYEDYDMLQMKIADYYWHNPMLRQDFEGMHRVDVWGEIVAGCQVHIASGFMMGWYLRYKLLFTRKEKDNGFLPYYIPGYGYRDDTAWGLNYYIGWKF